MGTDAVRSVTRPYPRVRRKGKGYGLYWLRTMDPKDIGVLLLFATSIVFGFANCVLPLLIGAPDLAFPRLSHKPLFGYTGMVFATLFIGGLSMLMWAHHMFATGAVLLPWFSFASYLIAIPTGIKFFNWIGTMWRGTLTFESAMLFCIGFMVLAEQPFGDLEHAARDTDILAEHDDSLVGLHLLRQGQLDYQDPVRGLVASCRGPQGSGEISIADVAFLPIRSLLGCTPPIGITLA